MLPLQDTSRVSNVTGTIDATAATTRDEKSRVVSESNGPLVDTTSGPLKRRKVERAKRGKRGLLKQINDIPLDVVFEIFSYLDPLDLLRLSRLTKDLRAILMTRSAGFVWERARRGVDLPPILDGMNQAQYAHLMCDSSCHSCGKDPCRYILWKARVRLCRACLDSGSIVVTYEQCYEACNGDIYMIQRGEDIFRIVEKEHMLDRPKETARNYFPVTAWANLIQKWESFGEDVDDRNLWIEEAVVERRLLFKQECGIVAPYQNWFQTRRALRKTEIEALREARWNSIVDRLKAAGWGRDLEEMNEEEIDDLRQHSMVYKTQKMTDRIWATIGPTMTEVVTRKRVATAPARRMALLEMLCKPLLAELPVIPVLPPLSHIAYLEPFRSIINDTPLLEDISAEHFASGFTQLAIICAQWRWDLVRFLKQVLRAVGRPTNLSLISSCFHCKRCAPSLILHFPSLVSHPCFKDHPERWRYDIIGTYSLPFLGYQPIWGVNPATTSKGALDNLNLWLQCVDCDTENEVTLMRWRAAMRHSHGSGRIRLSANKAYNSRAGVIEQDVLRKLPMLDRVAMICVHCGILVSGGIVSRRQHLTRHCIEGDVENHFMHEEAALYAYVYRVNMIHGLPLLARPS